MSYFLDERKFSGYIAKIVETPKNLFKNGIKFEKYSDRMVEPLSIADLSVGNTLGIQKMFYPNKNSSSYPLRWNGGDSQYIEDENNKDISYHIFNDNDLCVIENYDKVYLKRINYPSNYPYSSITFIGQDQNYIYALGQNASTPYTYGSFYIYKINKKTYLMEFIVEQRSDNYYSDFYPYILSFNRETQTCIIFNSRKYVYSGSGNLYGTIYFVDLKNKKIISKNSVSLLRSYDIISKPSNVIDNKYYFTLGNNSGIKIYKGDIIDYSMTALNIQHGINEIKNISQQSMINTHVFQRNNKNYIVISILYYEYHNSIQTYLFEETTDGKLNLIDNYGNLDEYYNISYFQESTNTLFLGNNKDISIFNLNNLTLNKVSTINGDINMFGFSTDNDFYIMYNDTSVDRIDTTVGINIIKKFEKTFYEFKGDFITSYIQVGLKNLNGEFVEDNILITLYGNMVFLDGSKTKEVKTSITGITEVPITIQGNSKLDFMVQIA